jgi:hypothetical protein
VTVVGYLFPTISVSPWYPPPLSSLVARVSKLDHGLYKFSIRSAGSLLDPLGRSLLDPLDRSIPGRWKFSIPPDRPIACLDRPLLLPLGLHLFFGGCLRSAGLDRRCLGRL